MMWPFRSKGDAELISHLKQERDQAEDAYAALVEAKCSAVAAMQEMQKATTDEGVAEIARGVTAQIADIYAAGGLGVKPRDIAVHAVVAAAIRKAVRGEQHWNEGGLARKAEAANA